VQVAIQAPVVQDERTKKLLREHARLIRKILARKSGHRCSKMTKTKKAAYMIPAVAEQYDVHPQTLRLYEREGLLKPPHSEGNTRLYTDQDLERDRLSLAIRDPDERESRYRDDLR